MNKAWREPKRAVGIESRRRTEHEAAAYGSVLAVQRRHVAPAHEMYGSAAHSSRTDGGAQWCLCDQRCARLRRADRLPRLCRMSVEGASPRPTPAFYHSSA